MTMVEEDTTTTTPPVKRPNAFIRLYRGETSFDFMGNRRFFYLISGIIILAGVVSLSVRGLNLGIDFKGGTAWSIPGHGLSVSQVQSAVEADGVTQPTVQILGGRTVQVQADLNSLSAADKSRISNSVTQTLARLTGQPASAVSIDDVGPTWGGQVTDKAVEAMIVFFVLVSIYIAVRFQWRMAIAALLKVIMHDLLITVGIFSLVGFQITPDAVIAVLTIMGYSLYDTVVVFDKITENTRGLGMRSRMSYIDLVNLSLNQVLARSLNTSLVAILPVLSVLIIGGQVLGATTLENFGVPLVIGIAAGAYSSIFIAAPRRSGTRADLVKSARAGGERPMVLTPRAAAELTAAAPAGRAARAASSTRRQGGVVRPGAARARAAAAATVEEELADEEVATGNGAAARANGAGRQGAGAARPVAKRPANAGARRPPPRPRKGKGKGKGGKRR
jgi:preprotein translocase subunit SecF